jgi:hypothetical protein
LGKDGILNGFDDKMRSLEQLMQSENERQEAALKTRLLEQRRRKREALNKAQSHIDAK